MKWNSIVSAIQWGVWLNLGCLYDILNNLLNLTKYVFFSEILHMAAVARKFRFDPIIFCGEIAILGSLLNRGTDFANSASFFSCRHRGPNKIAVICKQRLKCIFVKKKYFLQKCTEVCP